jgi:hypothetical protein
MDNIDMDMDMDNMAIYPQPKGINSRQSEHIIQSLRSLSVMLAFSRLEIYIRILEIFFVYRNLKVREAMKINGFIV